MKIVYFGTPPFAAEVLRYLLDHHVEVVAAITKPDKPKGRSGSPIPTPVKAVALEKKIPVFQPELVSAPEFADVLPPFQADLFVVVAYGEIIKQHLLDMPRLGCINLHASLLPKYRGAAPIQRAILKGEKETGVTIMHMVKKMDAGDIIKAVKVPITEEMSFGELEEILCHEGSPVLLEVIREFEQGIFLRKPQDDSLVTYAPKIELEDCQIDWNRSAEELHNLVRGVFPYPGAWCFTTVRGHSLRLKVFKTQRVDLQGAPGKILKYGKEGLIIGCGKGALRLLEVQLEGKRAMSAEEFMRGTPSEFLQIRDESGMNQG